MREAIDEGVVADYRVRVVELSAVGDKRAARKNFVFALKIEDFLFLQTFREHQVEWGPTLAVFNDVRTRRQVLVHPGLRSNKGGGAWTLSPSSSFNGII